MSQVYSSMENVSPAVCTRRGYRSYLRSNGVQLPTLLINPPPRRSTARSIVSRFHSQPHRRPSVRQRYLRGISPPARYILHYRPRPSESRSVYTRENHSASLDSIMHLALRATLVGAIRLFSRGCGVRDCERGRFRSGFVTRL